MAQIKQPKFEDQAEKNRLRQAEPRELRVVIEGDDLNPDVVGKLVGHALRGFYDQEAS